MSRMPEVREIDARYLHPRDEAQVAYQAMKDAGFPVVPPGQIEAEVAADVHRLGLDRTPQKGRR